MTLAKKLLASAASGFFGQFSMFREFWAEDPSWTGPGAGNDLVTVRDNGSAADDLTAGAIGGGAVPIYTASGINSKPTFEFLSSSGTVGGNLVTTAGSSGTQMTVGCVSKLDTTSYNQHFIDRESDGRFLIRSDIGSGDWSGFVSPSFTAASGTPDTSPHLFILKVLTNDMELWLDNVSIATDTSGTATSQTGCVMGGISTVLMNGQTSYGFMFTGDLTAESGYSDWITAIMTHYSL